MELTDEQKEALARFRRAFPYQKKATYLNGFRVGYIVTHKKELFTDGKIIEIRTDGFGSWGVAVMKDDTLFLVKPESLEPMLPHQQLTYI